MAASSTRPPQEKAKDGFVEIEGTVATGFEEAAEAEAREKFQTAPRRGRGNVTWDVPLKDVIKVLKMGSIDNVRAVIHTVNDMGFTDDETESMIKLRQLVVDVDWGWLVEVWRQFFQFEHQICTTSDLPKESFCQVVLSSQIKKAMNPPKAARGRGGKKAPGKESDKHRGKGGAGRGTVDASQGSVPTENNGMAAEARIESAGDAGEGEKPSEENKQQEEVSVGDVVKQDTASADSEQVPKESSADNTNSSSGDTGAKDEKTGETPKPVENANVPSFRVTCNRSGERHSFDSMGAASNFGGAIQEFLQWNVNLKNFNIEVILNIEDQKVMICVALTRESLHRRLLSSFGPTTLRPTISYNMLRLCHPQPGDIILDPLCGTGSIPIQGAFSWQKCYFMGGEINENGLLKTMENLTNLNEKRKQEDKSQLVMDAMRWDACRLPLRTGTIDVIISDLPGMKQPFGKRMGNKQDNRTLYPRIVQEMARVARPETGRLCLLTQDRKCLTKVLQSNKRYWQHRYVNGVNIGGLSAAVYLMIRTAEIFQSAKDGDWRGGDWRGRQGPWRARGPTCRGPGGGEGGEVVEGEGEVAADSTTPGDQDGTAEMQGPGGEAVAADGQ